MTRRLRHGTRIVLLTALAVVLAGCIKFDMDMTVSSDDMVSGTMVLAFEQSLLDMAGGSVDDIMSQGGEQPFPDDVEGVTVSEYDQDGFVGQQYSFEEIPLETFNEGSLSGSTGDTEQFRIERDGDVFRVSGAFDMSGGAGDLPAGEDLGMDPSMFLSGAELQIQLTFPGEVLESNGEVEGNTVTWDLDMTETNDLQAVAEAEPSGSSSALVLALVALAVLVVIGVVVMLVMRRRRSATPAAAGVGAVGTDDGTAATPPTPTSPASPPPAATTPSPGAAGVPPTAPPPDTTGTAAPSTPPPPPAAPDTERPDGTDGGADTDRLPPPPPPS